MTIGSGNGNSLTSGWGSQENVSVGFQVALDSVAQLAAFLLVAVLHWGRTSLGGGQDFSVLAFGRGITAANYCIIGTVIVN